VISRIIADSRETASGIPEELESKGVYVQRKMLDVGDYVVGHCVIERKTSRDFIISLYSGRLFEQAERISRAYQKLMLIVEGDVQGSLADMKNPRAYWGALLALALDFDFRIFFTLDQKQTADVLYLLARRTSSSKNDRPLLVRKPRMGTSKDWQLAVLESLPMIGPKLAEKLLQAFGSVRSIFLASRIELAVKGGIGQARAKRIQDLLDTEYRKSLPRQTNLLQKPSD
jgi:DNA excision repair protein ERCC-4